MLVLKVKMGCSSSTCKSAHVKGTLENIGDKTLIVASAVALDKNKDVVLDTMEELHVPTPVVQGTVIGFGLAEATGLGLGQVQAKT